MLGVRRERRADRHRAIAFQAIPRSYFGSSRLGYPAQNFSTVSRTPPADAPLFENGSGAVATTAEKPAPIARPKPSGAAKPWQKEPRF